MKTLDDIIDNSFKFRKFTTIDAEAMVLLKEILRQNSMILELLCNPILVENPTEEIKHEI